MSKYKVGGGVSFSDISLDIIENKVYPIIRIDDDFLFFTDEVGDERFVSTEGGNPFTYHDRSSKDMTKKYTFTAPCHGMISHGDLYDALTREQPASVAITSKGKMILSVHHTISLKVAHCKKKVRDEYEKAMEPFYRTDDIDLDSAVLSRATAAIKAVRNAPVKGEGPVNVTVTML